MQREHKCSTSRPRYREARRSEWLEACGASIRRNRAMSAPGQTPGDTPPASPCLHRQGPRVTQGAAGHRVGSHVASHHRALLTAAETRLQTPLDATLQHTRRSAGGAGRTDVWGQRTACGQHSYSGSQDRGKHSPAGRGMWSPPRPGSLGPEGHARRARAHRRDSRYLSLAPESTWCPGRRSA